MKNRKNKSKKNNKDRSFFLLKLTNCSTLFMCLLFMAFFALYVSGNFKQFSDSTQINLLYFCSVVEVGLFLISFAGLIESIIYFFINKMKRMWIFFVMYLFFVILTPPFYLVLRLILHMTEGIK